MYSPLNEKLSLTRCSEAEKVTAGLATHWSCVTDFVVIHLRAQGRWKADEHVA